MSPVGEQRLVWYRYRIGGHYTTSNYEAKLLQVIGQLSGKPNAAVIALATDINPGKNTARMQLSNFLSNMESPLTAAIDGLSKDLEN